MAGIRQLALVVFGILVPDLAGAADVQIRILNVVDSAGNVRVAVCRAAEWLGSQCSYNASMPSQPGPVVVTVRRVPPGIYGIQAHHDSNGDGRINKNLLGVPTEGIGFSRNAKMRFGPPRFTDAAVQVTEPKLALDVTLVFEPSRIGP